MGYTLRATCEAAVSARTPHVRTAPSVQHTPKDPQQHRLLPRFRNPLADRARMERQQATILVAELEANPDRKLPLRHELTKPGDPLALRGIPLVGAAAGAINGTKPEQETVRRITQRERINARAQ